jgi:hypothetical protein
MTKREACERIVADNNCREVFSAEKFYADESSLECLRALSRESGWPEDCNGKTEEECEELGFEVHKNWMEER